MRWLVIYLVDSAIQHLNNPGVVLISRCLLYYSSHYMYEMSLFDKPTSIKQDFFMHSLAFSKMVRLFALHCV